MKNKIKETILITGCAGFIGFHLVKKLSALYEIVGIDNLNNYYDVCLKKDRLKKIKKIDSFKFFEIDILNHEDIKKIFQVHKIDFIIHLAAQAGVRFSLKYPQKYIDNNISGFLNILEASKNNKISKIFYASSSSVYGSNINLPYIENDRTDYPLSFYGVTKKTNELMANYYSNTYEMKLVGLRFFTVYGPWGRPDMSYFKFTQSILRNDKIQVYNNGNHSRSFTYIDDIVHSIFLLIKKIDNIEKKSILINIGGSESIKLIDYIKIIEKSLNMKARIDFLPLQKGDVKHTHSNVDLLSSIINFKPQITLKDGIDNFIEWYCDYYKI